MVWNRIFRVRLFWVKMILGNHFPPNPHVWLQRKMKFFGNSLPVDRNLRLWLGNEFTLSFSLQFISGKRERERGREKKESPDRRERGRRDFAGDRAARQSTSALVGRSHCSSINERRDRRAVWSSDECARQSCPSSIAIASAIVWKARSSIAPLVGRSHWSRLHRAISSSPALRDLNLTGFDEFFCWVLFLLWMSVELIHYLHVYSWGSVWKIGHVKHFL